MSGTALYADVIIPVSIEGTFTYRIPDVLQNAAKSGMRVVVQLGKSKLYTAIISRVHQDAPQNFQTKDILTLLDSEPVVTSRQLQFWEWISQYYMCQPGEVMQAALPGGMKLSGETVFRLNPETAVASNQEDVEDAFLDYIRDEEPLTLQEIRKGPFGDAGIGLAKALTEKNLLVVDQKYSGGYKPLRKTFIRFKPEYMEERVLSELLDQLSRAPAQQKVIEKMVLLSDFSDEGSAHKQVEKSRLMAEEEIRASAVQALVRKNVLETYEEIQSRIHHTFTPGELLPLPGLSAKQEIAFNQLKEGLQKTSVALLHGVTSSGKTEIYIRLIKEQAEQGKQVLYLLPEIAITTQIIRRLKSVFGEEVGIYHSRYNDNERVEVYRNLAGLSGEKPFSVILGVRSAIFLPFRNLGLVIIDEEHENTYKQFDPAPRYHARDASVIMAMYQGAQVVMGSATPSLESLYNARQGKYAYVNLTERYGKVSLPEIIVADVAVAMKRKQLKSHFTPELIRAMEETFANNKQVILFQNRRGFSNYLQCMDCSSIVKCRSCDVSLTYHKFKDQMICHYCGFRMHVPVNCPDCHHDSLKMRGFGTEKIEEAVAEMFPGVAAGRLDLDKSRSRKAFEKVISDFEAGKLQVLVGTQMVTKGLDFEHVGLVGIIDADSMMNFPDFRAFERSFQLMVQVSGRAGRRKDRGKVVIQTMDVSHPVISHILEDNFERFVENQLEERRLFKYPPYTRLVRLTLRHEIPSILEAGAIFLANELKETFGSRVLGPQQPPVARVQGKHIRHILLKLEKEVSLEKSKQIIRANLELFHGSAVHRQIRVNVDVDPM